MAGGNGNARGGTPKSSPRGGQMPPPRGPRGGGGGQGGAGHPAASYGVGGNDHGSDNRGGRDGNHGGRGGGRGGHGGGRGRRGSRGGNQVHGNAQSMAASPPQSAAPTAVVSNAAPSTAKTGAEVANNGNVAKSTSTDRPAVSTPCSATPANSFAVPNIMAAANPASLPAILPATNNREARGNPGSSIQASVSQDTPAMTVNNPASLPASTASKTSATTTSNAAQNPPSLVPSTPSRIFGTFGSNNRASFGTPFFTNITSSVFRSCTPVPSSSSLATGASGAVQFLQSNPVLPFPSPSTNKNAFGGFGRSATPSVPPVYANTSPLLAFGSNATIFAAPMISAPTDFRAPQFREYRESSLSPVFASTNSLGTFGSTTDAFALPPALRHPTGTIQSEATERTNITSAKQPETQATSTILGKRRAASKLPEPNLTQGTEGAAHTDKRLKTESQTEFSAQEPSTAPEVSSASAFISQELQTWGSKLKELDHDFEEQHKAWIKRQELETWREQERKKLATKREACEKVLQSAREKMENIVAEAAKLQRDYLEKLAAIEKKDSGDA